MRPDGLRTEKQVNLCLGGNFYGNKTLCIMGISWKFYGRRF